MTVPEDLSQLLDRLLAGTATPAEEAVVRQWLASLPSGRGAEYETLLAHAQQRVAAGLPDVDASAALAEMHERMAGPRLRLVQRCTAWQRPAILAAAACLVLAAGAAFLREASRVARGGVREYVTAAAQREKITLADGTELTLAPASRLRFAADYGRTNRDVYLDGEAFFAVRHDAAHPFAVHAGGAVARDVGTRFDVRAYSDDRAVRVAVVEGVVAVGATGSSGTGGKGGKDAALTNGSGSSRGGILAAPAVGAVAAPASAAVATAAPAVGAVAAPASAAVATAAPAVGAVAAPASAAVATAAPAVGAGDVAVVSDGAVALTHSSDVADLTAWTEGRLVFRAAPLSEVARELGRWYDLDVRVDGARLGERTFSGSYTTESAEQVLSLVTAAVGARYERHGRVVTIQ